MAAMMRSMILTDAPSFLRNSLLFQDLLREPEHQPGNDDEIHPRPEHGAQEEVHGAHIDRRGAPSPAWNEERHYRHEDAVYERRHERVCLAADDHCDGQADDAVLLQERQEFAAHGWLLPKDENMVTGALLGRLATRAWADTRRGREANRGAAAGCRPSCAVPRPDRPRKDRSSRHRPRGGTRRSEGFEGGRAHGHRC